MSSRVSRWVRGREEENKEREGRRKESKEEQGKRVREEGKEGENFLNFITNLKYSAYDIDR